MTLVSNDAIETTALTLDDHTYYRSRVFTSEFGVNSLLSAAQPLLIFVSRLAQSHTQPDVEQLVDPIQHELKTFESRCLHYRLDSETIALGRYWLMLALNATILQQPWHSQWQRVDPFKTDSNKEETLKHLMAVLEKMHLDPRKHLDNFELAYVCLCLAQIDTEWQALIDPIYQRIKQYKSDNTTPLFLSNIAPNLWQHKKVSKTWPVWITVCVCLLLLSIFYAGFSYMITLNSRVISMTTTSINPNKVTLNEDL